MDTRTLWTYELKLSCILIPVCAALLGCATRQDLPAKPIVSSSDVTQGSNVSRDVMAGQIPLVEIAEKLRRSDGASRTLGGIRLSVENKTVEVWWKGSLGEAQRAIVEEAKSRGIRVNVEPAKYSQAELLAAVQGYLDQRPTVTKELAYLAPRVDGSGLDVGLTSDFDIRRLELGVDVFAVWSSPIENLSRAIDVAPWWGGAVISGVGTGQMCSSGFAVNWGWSIDRADGQGLLTANHCAPGGGVPFNNGAGSPVGMAFPRPTGQSIVLDSLLIRTSGPASSRIYVGGVGSNASSPVVGWTSVFPGMSICHSGASSGTVCGLVVSTIKATAFVGSVFTQSVAIANLSVPSIVVRSGDSGGPVFMPAANPAEVIAAGTLVGSLVLNCRPPVGIRRCQTGVAFVDMDVLTFHQVSLITQPPATPTPTPTP